MPQSAPIKITFYGPDDEVEREFVRSIIPWGILKKVIRFAKSVNLDALDDLSSIPENMADELASIVVMVFGDRFTVEELEKGVDIGDMMVLIQNIIARANLAANPTPPGK